MLAVGDKVTRCRETWWSHGKRSSKDDEFTVFKNRGSDRHIRPFVVYKDDKPSSWDRITLSGGETTWTGEPRWTKVGPSVIEDWRL